MKKNTHNSFNRHILSRRIKVNKKHFFLIFTGILALNACVSVPAETSPQYKMSLKRQCDQRLPMVENISNSLQKGMKSSALSKKIMKNFSLPDNQQGEIATLIHYIGESISASSTGIVDANSHKQAYKNWCYDSLIDGNKTAWLPDYFKNL